MRDKMTTGEILNLPCSCIPPSIGSICFFGGYYFFSEGHMQVDITLGWNWTVGRAQLNKRIETWSLKQNIRECQKSMRYKDQGVFERQLDENFTFLQIEHSASWHR